MQWYDRCFTSLRRSTFSVQTIVVDNTPGEEDAEYIRAHFPEIYLIKTGENLGFGKANNIAMRYALDNGCDYVFLLNQDTWILDDEMFAKLVYISVKHPEYGILSPLHMKSDERTLGMMLECGHDRCSMAILVDMIKGSLNDVYPTNFVSAAAWLLPRKTLETVGGFDPIYQHYEEDDDYINRVLYHKLRVGICPTIRMVHDHQESVLPFSDDKNLFHHQQNIIVCLTNINYTNTVNKKIRYYLRKIILSFLVLDWCALRGWWRDYCFVRENKNVIYASRKQNMQVGTSWL